MKGQGIYLKGQGSEVRGYNVGGVRTDGRGKSVESSVSPHGLLNSCPNSLIHLLATVGGNKHTIDYG